MSQVLIADWNRLERIPVGITSLVLLENASFAGNPGMVDDANPQHRQNRALMTTLNTICVDHGGKVQMPSVEVAASLDSLVLEE